MKRIVFTAAELEAIISMEAIAGAGGPEGDYADWTPRTYDAAASAATKAAILLGRKSNVGRTTGAKL